MCDRCSSVAPKYFTCSRCRVGKFCSEMCGNEMLRQFHGKTKCIGKDPVEQKSLYELLDDLEQIKQKQPYGTTKLDQDPIKDAYLRGLVHDQKVAAQQTDAMTRYLRDAVMTKYNGNKVLADQVVGTVQTWHEKLVSTAAALGEGNFDPSVMHSLGDITAELEKVFSLLNIKTMDPEDSHILVDAKIIADEVALKLPFVKYKKTDSAAAVWNDNGDTRNVEKKFAKATLQKPDWWDNRFKFVDQYIKTGHLTPELMGNAFIGARTKKQGSTLNDNNNESSDDEEEEQKLPPKEKEEEEEDEPLTDSEKARVEELLEKMKGMDLEDKNKFRKFLSCFRIESENIENVMFFTSTILILGISGYYAHDWILSGYEYFQKWIAQQTEETLRKILEQNKTVTELNQSLVTVDDKIIEMSKIVASLKQEFTVASDKELADFTAMQAFNLPSEGPSGQLKLKMINAWCEAFRSDTGLHEKMGTGTWAFKETMQWTELYQNALNNVQSNEDVRRLLIEVDAKKLVVNSMNWAIKFGATSFVNKSIQWLTKLELLATTDVVLRGAMNEALGKMQNVTANLLTPFQQNITRAALRSTETTNIFLRYVQMGLYGNESYVNQAWQEGYLHAHGYSYRSALLSYTAQVTGALNFMHRYVMENFSNFAGNPSNPTLLELLHSPRNRTMAIGISIFSTYSYFLIISSLTSLILRGITPDTAVFRRAERVLLELQDPEEAVYTKKGERLGTVRDIVVRNTVYVRFARYLCRFGATAASHTPEVITLVSMTLVLYGFHEGHNTIVAIGSSSFDSWALNAIAFLPRTIFNPIRMYGEALYNYPGRTIEATLAAARLAGTTINIIGNNLGEVRRKGYFKFLKRTDRTIKRIPGAGQFYEGIRIASALHTPIIWILFLVNLFFNMNMILDILGYAKRGFLGNQPHWPQYQTREDRIRKTRNQERVLILE